MNKSGTATPRRASRPTTSTHVDQNDALRRARIVDATVAGLKVSEYRHPLRRFFDDVPLKAVHEGSSVTVTVRLDSMRGMNDGRAAGIVTGSGGRAIITMSRDTLDAFGPVLTSGSRVTVRGLARTVNGHRTITVTAVQAVAA